MGTRFLKVFLVAMGLVAGCGTPNNPASPQSADATVNGGRTLLGSRALQLKVDTEPTGGARLRTTHGVSQLLDFLGPDGAVHYAEVPLLDSAVPDIGFVPRGEYGGIIYRSWAAYVPGDRIEVKFTLPGTSQLVDLLVPNAGGVGYPAQGQFTVAIDVLPPEIEGYAATLVVNGNAKIQVRFVEQLRFTLGSAGAGTYAVEDTRFSPAGETTVLNRDSFSLRELKFSRRPFRPSTWPVASPWTS